MTYSMHPCANSSKIYWLIFDFNTKKNLFGSNHFCAVLRSLMYRQNTGLMDLWKVSSYLVYIYKGQSSDTVVVPSRLCINCDQIFAVTSPHFFIYTSTAYFINKSFFRRNPTSNVHWLNMTTFPSEFVVAVKKGECH